MCYMSYVYRGTIYREHGLLVMSFKYVLYELCLQGNHLLGTWFAGNEF
jgi:hypothetical protein